MEVLSEADQKKVARLLRWFCDQRRIHNKEKFKRLPGTEASYELKAGRHVRLLGFWWHERHTFVIAHCVVKKRGRLMPKDLTKAESIRKSFLKSYGEESA